MTRRGDDTFRALGEALDARLGEIMGELGRAIEEAADRGEHLRPQAFMRERSFRTPRGHLQAGMNVRVGGLAVGPGARADAGEDPASDRAVARPRNRHRAATARTADDAAAAGACGSDPKAQAPVASTAEETLLPVAATILEAEGIWTLVADLPGVGQDGLTIRQGEDGDVLVIEASGQRRRYAGRFELPRGLSVAALSIRIVNGILELRGEVARP